MNGGNGRLLLLRREGKILTLLFRGNRLEKARAAEAEAGGLLGTICIGKIKNVPPGLNAAFVEYAPGSLCFLPFAECKDPLITNRVFDGRLVAGDEILIQINREALKSKEPGATANLSFSGKYLVISTGRRQTGFSGKLSPARKEWLKTETQKLSLFQEVCARYGLVYRTNCETLSGTKPLVEELKALYTEAQQIEKVAIHRTCFSVLKGAPAGYLKCLTDFYASEYEKILTDDTALYEEVAEYLRAFQPEDLEKLTFYEDALLPLERLYSVETRLSEALAKKVWLKSGGYLVIEPTEALVSIDVNSGKASGRKGSEETFYRLNREAAEEIAHQLRLRSLSGIIIVDFINMKSEEHKKGLLSHLKECLARDSVRTEVVDITPLGLVEITRKKITKTLWEQLKR